MLVKALKSIPKFETESTSELVERAAMHLSRVASHAVRLSVTQAGLSSGRQPLDKIVFPSALVLAFFGLGLSTFSVKQLLSSSSSRVAGRF